MKKIIILLWVLLLAVPVYADELEEGRKAWLIGNYKEALNKLSPLADRGNPVAQTIIGNLYENGHGVLQDYQKAFNWYLKSAKNNFSPANYFIGKMYEEGRIFVEGASRNFVELSEMRQAQDIALELKKRIEQIKERFVENINSTTSGSFTNDQEQKLRNDLTEREKAYARSQERIKRQKRTFHDLKKELSLQEKFKKELWNFLFKEKREGRLLNWEFPEKFAWKVESLAEDVILEAKSELSPHRMEWFLENLIKNLDSITKQSIDEIYDVKRFNEAIKWYQVGSKQNHVCSQFSLGRMYSNRESVGSDYVKAHMWFNIAGANGLEEGLKNREVVEKRMTRGQVAEAQKLAREWMEKHGKN